MTESVYSKQMFSERLFWERKSMYRKEQYFTYQKTLLCVHNVHILFNTLPYLQNIIISCFFISFTTQALKILKLFCNRCNYFKKYNFIVKLDGVLKIVVLMNRMKNYENLKYLQLNVKYNLLRTQIFVAK